MNNHRRVGLLLLVLLGPTGPSGCRDDGPSEPVFTGKGGTPGTSPGTGGAVADGAAPLFDTGAPDVSTGQPFSKAALITAIADCATDRYQTFVAAAAALQNKASAYAGSLSAPALAEAQDAWRFAMAIWQELEFFQIGPAAATANPGGQGLRTQIYSFPQSARCGVDQQIVNQAYQRPDFPSTFVNSRGLDALEYLLFYAGSANACLPTTNINTEGTWAALDAATLQRRRADYAVAAAADVLARAQSLQVAWTPGTANFRQQFTSAGAGSALFATDHDALNAASDALFYLDREVKDLKVGRPVGLVDCLTATCPDGLESPYARASTSNIVQNLLGFQRLFFGCGADGAGVGFDDWLHAVSQGGLVVQMQTALASAIASAQGLQPPLEDAINAAPDRVRALHAAVKALNDLLKTQFITVLNLDLPATVEGDND